MECGRGWVGIAQQYGKVIGIDRHCAEDGQTLT